VNPANRARSRTRSFVPIAEAERRVSAGQSFTTSLIVPSPPAAQFFRNLLFYARRAISSASPVRVVGARQQIAREQFNVRPVRWARSLCAALRMIRCTSHLSRFRFIFFSNMVCVTSRRAKIRPPRIYFSFGGLVNPWSGPFLALNLYVNHKDTSEDPAGTFSPALWRDLKIGR